MKIKLYSHYDHFPNHKATENEPCIEMYNDNFVMDSTEGSCALLIEPRSICPSAYEYVEQNFRKFRYVFTHDSQLLAKCDNAKLIIWGWGNGNYMSFSDRPKTKGISMVSSDKEMCELHKGRKQLALRYNHSGIVDCYGTFNGGRFASVEEYLADYRYSIVIENYIDDYWFTEKIFNCFANKVIPIYVGARKITDFFNRKGILRVGCWECLMDNDWINMHNPDTLRYEYEVRLPAVINNYHKVKEFPDFETWFFKRYGELLNEY